MSESNVVNIVDSLRENGAENPILYKLAAVGINAVYNSWRNDKSEILEGFGKLPKHVISEMWSELDSKIKVAYVDANEADFKEWLNNGR